jgi:predicted DNA-binding WGR domain protein/tetratricopeptide (TPR) repeat protein
MALKKRFINFSPELFWQIEVACRSLVITSGRNTTLGKATNMSFPTEKECLKEAERLIMEIRRQGYHESTQLFVPITTPAPLQKASLKKRILKSEGRKFILFENHDISIITIAIKNERLSDPILQKHQEPGAGMYCSIAYALGCEINDEGPRIFLVWLPSQDLFGLWDRCNGQLLVFPGVNWTDINYQPFDYLKTDSEGDAFPEIQNYLPLEEHFVFIPSDLDDQVHRILSLSDHDLRKKKVEFFLATYESRLLSLPFCSELRNAFNAVVTLYYRIGQWLESDSDYVQAITWFEKSQQVLDQSARFRVLFSDIYLQLSFCYLETSKFDLALLYIDLFAQYDVSSREACSKIKDSIYRTQQLYKDTMNAFLKDIEQASEEGYDEADSVIKQAIASAPHDPILHFNLACYYASTNRIKDALHHLEEAFKNGYKNYEKVINDQDLENLRYTAEFEDIRLKYLFIAG